MLVAVVVVAGRASGLIVVGREAVGRAAAAGVVVGLVGGFVDIGGMVGGAMGWDAAVCRNDDIAGRGARTGRG